MADKVTSKTLTLTDDEAAEYFSVYIEDSVKWRSRYETWDAQENRPIPTPESVASSIRRSIVLEWLKPTSYDGDFFVKLYRRINPTYAKILDAVRLCWPSEEERIAINADSMLAQVKSTSPAVYRSMTVQDLVGQGLNFKQSMEAHALIKSFMHMPKEEGTFVKGYVRRSGRVAVVTPQEILAKRRGK